MGPSELEAPPRRVSYDPATPGREMTIEQASKGLSWLYRNQRQVFADMRLYVDDLDFKTTKPRKSSGK